MDQKAAAVKPDAKKEAARDEKVRQDLGLQGCCMSRSHDEEEEEPFPAQNFFEYKEFKAKLEERFAQLPDCTQRFKRDVVKNLLDQWTKVVKVIGTGTKNGRQLLPWSGTGFLVQSPGKIYNDNGINRILSSKIKSLVLTNRHVYNDNNAENIRMVAQFEQVDGTTAEFALSPKPVFISSMVRVNEGGQVLPQEKKNELDFIAFEFEWPAPELLRPLMKLTCDFIRWEESKRVYNLPRETPVVIIGHPKGLPKRGSISTLTAQFDTKLEECFMEYDAQHAYSGNSGSPVFAILPSKLHEHLSLDGSAACALHFRIGMGVTFLEGIAEQLRSQFANQMRLTDEQFIEHRDSGKYTVI